MPPAYYPVTWGARRVPETRLPGAGQRGIDGYRALPLRALARDRRARGVGGLLGLFRFYLLLGPRPLPFRSDISAAGRRPRGL